MNPNNILYDVKTGNFRLIDFEPVTDGFTFSLLNTRLGLINDALDTAR